MGFALLLVVGTWGAPRVAKEWRFYQTPPQQNLPLHKSLVALGTEEGQALLEGAEDRADYTAVKKFFQSQIRLAYCGVASSVIALNALNEMGGTSATWSQDTFFDHGQTIRSEYDTTHGGMTLAQLAGLLNERGARAQAVHASDSSVVEFRTQVRENLAREGDVVLVNYVRKAIHQKTGGHISPLAAYDEDTDRFLVMDVSTYKYPPVWVKTEALWAAMNTVDGDSNRTRGYVLVQAPVDSGT